MAPLGRVASDRMPLLPTTEPAAGKGKKKPSTRKVRLVNLSSTPFSLAVGDGVMVASGSGRLSQAGEETEELKRGAHDVRATAVETTGAQSLLPGAECECELAPAGRPRTTPLVSLRSRVASTDDSEELALLLKRHKIYSNAKFQTVLLASNADGKGKQRQGDVHVLSRSTSVGSEVLLLPARDMGSWMAGVPDEKNLGSLWLPGTHETLALYGWPLATCQSTTLTEQLNGGVRFVDLRFALKPGGRLIAFHSIKSQYLKCGDVLEALYVWLEEHPTETVIISVKQENSAPGAEFESAFWELVWKRNDKWYLEDRWPALGEVRGKIVLFCRFDHSMKRGIHPRSWAYNSRTAWGLEIGRRDCVVQDWYSIGTFLFVPEKAALVLSMLPPASVTSSTTSRTCINFASASGLPAAFPPLVARGLQIPTFFGALGFKGLNRRVRDGLWDWAKAGPRTPRADTAPEEPREEGHVLLLDYWEEPGGIVELVVDRNFR